MTLITQKKILLVEDTFDIRVLYAEVLRDSDYLVSEAADGQEGLEKALNEDWDLMLLDIMLPKVDGVALLKQVRDVPALATKPIVLLTNLGSEHLIKECFGHGANGYVIKSEITLDDLLQEVKNSL